MILSLKHSQESKLEISKGTRLKKKKSSPNLDLHLPRELADMVPDTKN